MKKESLEIIVRFEIVRARESDPVACPLCGTKPHGISQVFVAPATVISERSSIHYDGNGTDAEILWNSVQIVSAQGLAVLVCKEGHHFVHPKIEVPKES